MQTILVVVVVAMVALGLASPGAAQTVDERLRTLGKEIETLKEGQTRMQRDLQEIKTLLRSREAAAPQAPPEPQNVVLDLRKDQIKGDPGARLVLVDFTDYQ